jgi:adenosylcobinamide amidohydrolase
MKLRIGSAVLGFFSPVLLLGQLAFAQTPPTATFTRVNLSGAAFICANQVATGTCPDAEYDPALGSLQNAQGTWAANVALPQAAAVSKFELCGNFNEVGSSITATLYRTALAATSGFPTAVAMATVQSTGASDETQCFKTTAITDAAINNSAFQYYVVVVVPDNNGVIFTSVGIEY